MGEMKDEKEPAPLRGVAVIDLTDERGSFCAKLLADLGARVLRIEGRDDAPSRQSDPLSYAYHNGGKERLVIDLTQRDGRRTLRRLLKTSDVFIETLPARLLGRLRLGPKLLTRLNPRLVHLSISGLGRGRNNVHHRWNNDVISALGGQTYVSGPLPGPPVPVPGNQSYYAASLFGATALLLALRERAFTGRGRFIDLSAREAVASTLDHVMVDYFHEGAVTRRQGNVYGDRAFVILPCKDGHIQITILQNWDTLVELLSSEGMAEDLLREEWKERAYREEHFDHVVRVVSGWTSGHTKMELFELGQAMRFPWAPVCTAEEVMASPQLQARRFFLPVRPSPAIGQAPSLPGSPYRFMTHSFDRRNAHVSAPIDRTVTVAHHDRGAEHLGPEGRAQGTLRGIRVLDFTWMLAGPYATRILGDAGAEVIKVQSRRTAKGGEDNSTGYFATWNRNKRSITLDLDQPEARRIVVDLAAKSDVVVENFSPRIMANWGLTYGNLVRAKPDLIMASISAMGQTGPWRDYVAFGPTFHALSGLTSLMSEGLDAPVCLGHAYGDTIIGLYGALAILAALRLRDTTGQGRYVDLSGYEAVCSVLAPALLQGAGKGAAGGRSPRLGCCYRCRGGDRWCVISPSLEDEWRALWSVIGASLDPFPSMPMGMESREGRRELIGRWTIDRSPEQAVRLLGRAGVPAGVVQNAEDLANERHLEGRHFFVPLQHPALGTTVSDRTPLFFDGPEPARWRPAPLLGEANSYVLGELLGMSDDEIRSYSERGIVG